MTYYNGLAFVGRAGVGKTHVANMVGPMLNLPVVAFADSPKKDLATIGVEKGQPLFRELIISYVENRRAIHGGDYLIERFLLDNGGPSNCCIDDARRMNEVMALHSWGYMIVHLWEDPKIRAKRLGLAEDDPFLTSDTVSESDTDHPPYCHLWFSRFDGESNRVASEIVRTYRYV